MDNVGEETHSMAWEMNTCKERGVDVAEMAGKTLHVGGQGHTKETCRWTRWKMRGRGRLSCTATMWYRQLKPTPPMIEPVKGRTQRVHRSTVAGFACVRSLMAAAMLQR